MRVDIGWTRLQTSEPVSSAMEWLMYFVPPIAIIADIMSAMNVPHLCITDDEDDEQKHSRMLRRTMMSMSRLARARI